MKSLKIAPLLTAATLITFGFVYTSCNFDKETIRNEVEKDLRPKIEAEIARAYAEAFNTILGSVITTNDIELATQRLQTMDLKLGLNVLDTMENGNLFVLDISSDKTAQFTILNPIQQVRTPPGLVVSSNIQSDPRMKQLAEFAQNRCENTMLCRIDPGSIFRPSCAIYCKPPDLLNDPTSLDTYLSCLKRHRDSGKCY